MLRRENTAEGKQFNFYVVNTGGWEPRADSSLVPDSGPNSPWYHIAGTYDKDGGANNLKIYVNGVLSAQATKAGTVDTSANSLMIGGLGALFTGLIDEVRVYSRALGADEVAAGYLSKPKPVQFTGSAAALEFKTPERVVFAGSSSDYITVEALDGTSQKSTGFNDTVTVTSSSSTGRFSQDKANWSVSNETSIMLVNGSGDLYYKDTVVDTFVITVWRAGLGPDTQSIFIVPTPPASRWMSFISLGNSARAFASDGSTACTVSVFIRDVNGNPLEGKQATVYSSRLGSDTIAQPGLTDSNGQCTATVISSVPGGDTLFAVSEGETFYENIINNPSFEKGSVNPEMWGQNIGVFTWVTDEVYTGAKAQRTDAPTAADRWVGAQWSGTPYADRWPITGNTNFYVRQYVKTNLSTGDARIRIIWFKDGAVLNEQAAASITGINTWTLLQATVTSLADANGLMYRCHTGGVGTTWFDGVLCRRVPTVEWTGAEKLAILTPAREISAGSASESIAIQAQWSDSTPATSYTGKAALSSSSIAGKFAAAPSGPWSTTLTVNFENGETFVYYLDTKAGSPVITVTELGLTSCTQVPSVRALTVSSETTSYIVIPQGCASDGITQAKVKVFVTDAFYNPISGKTVIITTARKGTADDGYDTITQPSQATDENGMAEGYIVSSLSGRDTITAGIDGEPGKVINTAFLNTAPSSGRWDFDEGTGDIAYSPANSGKITGAAWAAGRYGSCLSFDGAGDFVEVPDADSLDPAAITITMWFRASNMDQGDKYLVNRVSTGAEGYRIGGVSGSKIWWNVPVTGWNYSLGSSGNVTADKWTHLAVAYDGSYMRIYFNGNESGNLARTGGINASPIPLYIGAFNSGSAYFTGQIDEVRMFSRALSVDEIRAEYAGRSKTITWVSAAKIAIITPPRAVPAGSASESICVQAQWADGSKASDYSEDCEFTSSSPNGFFCVSATGETWTSSLVLKIINGETFVYYKDLIGGSSTITVKSGGMPETTQVQTVLAGSFSGTASYMWFSSSRMPADGTVPCTVNVFVKDSFGNPLADKTVTIMTNRGISDTITQPAATDENGMCTGSVVSALMGDVNITASCEGMTITMAVLRDVCVGMWPLDEGSGIVAKDYSPSGKNGTLMGNPVPSWVDGKYGKALEFNGTSPGNSVQGSYPVEMRIQLDNVFTYSAWVKVYSGSSWGTIFRGTAGNPGIEMEGNGSIRFLQKTASGWPDLLVHYNAPVNAWTHVVVTGDGSKYYMYVNGEKKQTAAAGTLVDEGQAVWMIGGRGDAWNLRGCVDDVMLLDRCLSDTEVVTQYQLRLLSVRFTACRLNFAAAPFKTKSGSAAAVTVTATDLNNNIDGSFSENISLLTTSNSGIFSAALNPWQGVTSIALAGGSATFYYRDYTAGIPVITISRAGLITASQQERVTASKMKITSSAFRISASQISDTLTAEARDELGAVDAQWNETVSLSTSFSAGHFSLDRDAWQNTSVVQMASGAVSFFYRSTKGGTPTITAFSIDIADTQTETIVMPVITVTKYQKNERIGGNTTSLPVELHSGDTIEWTIRVRNSGTETATGIEITDKSAFDTTLYDSIVFLSSDPSQADSSCYTTDPAFSLWISGSPAPNSEDIKGLRWFINTLGIKQQREVKFRARVK